MVNCSDGSGTPDDVIVDLVVGVPFDADGAEGLELELLRGVEVDVVEEIAEVAAGRGRDGLDGGG